MKISITSVHEIAAAHWLPFHEGKCKRHHGHNYKLFFSHTGPIQTGPGSETGMVLDFGTFDAAIKDVLAQVDHYSLNLDCGIDNPTAENFGLWLMERLPLVTKLEIWETGRHYATLERDESPDPKTEPDAESIQAYLTRYQCPSCKDGDLITSPDHTTIVIDLPDGGTQYDQSAKCNQCQEPFIRRTIAPPSSWSMVADDLAGIHYVVTTSSWLHHDVEVYPLCIPGKSIA